MISNGETLITVARAVAAQYANVTPVEHVYPLVAARSSLDRVLDESRSARHRTFYAIGKGSGRAAGGKMPAINIPSLSIIGPVMQLFQAYLGGADHRAWSAPSTS